MERIIAKMRKHIFLAHEFNLQHMNASMTPDQVDILSKRFYDLEHSLISKNRELISKECISLAYQKVGDKIVRKDVNHLTLIRNLKNKIIQEPE